MKTGNIPGLAWRIGVCVVVVAALVAYFARELAPSVPLMTVFGWTIGGIALAGAILAAVIFVEGSFNRWTFTKGGLDTQWLWFREDPPGTAQLRAMRRDDAQ